MNPRVTAMFNSPLKSIVTIASGITAIGVIIGAVLTVDSRYVHAEEFIKMHQAAQQQLQLIQEQQKTYIDELRKQTIEDKLFELRLKQTKTSIDWALIKRYEDQLAEVIARINKVLPIH